MNEIQRPIEVIETEINFYKNQMCNNAIEIGKRLKEAREQVNHGEWGNWTYKNGFSTEKARQYIKVYEEFGNHNALCDLEFRKLFLLTGVPSDKRQEIIDSNPINDITTRELERVIKAKKQADLKIEDLEQRLQSKPKQIEVPPPDYKEAKAELEKLKNELELAELEKQQLQRRLKEETNPELFQQMAKRESEARVEVHQLKKQLEAMEADSKTVEHKVKIASVNFCARVHNFLESVGGMVWINDYADSFTEKEKQEYFKALDAVEAWAQHVRNNFKENE